MKTKWILVLIATIALAIAAVLNWPADNNQIQPNDSEAFGGKPELEETRLEKGPKRVEEAMSQAATSYAALLEIQYLEAKEVFLEAERELDSLEDEVEQVERYVEDLEARGLDPAKFAEEGMELLNPVIDQYESRLEILQAAEKEMSAARAAFDAATN